VANVPDCKSVKPWVRVPLALPDFSHSSPRGGQRIVYPYQVGSSPIYGAIVKCYQGIVNRRINYAGLTVRGTGPDITASRLPEEAPLLANRHDNT